MQWGSFEILPFTLSFSRVNCNMTELLLNYLSLSSDEVYKSANIEWMRYSQWPHRVGVPSSSLPLQGPENGDRIWGGDNWSSNWSREVVQNSLRTFCCPTILSKTCKTFPAVSPLTADRTLDRECRNRRRYWTNLAVNLNWLNCKDVSLSIGGKAMDLRLKWRVDKWTRKKKEGQRITWLRKWWWWWLLILILSRAKPCALVVSSTLRWLSKMLSTQFCRPRTKFTLEIVRAKSRPRWCEDVFVRPLNMTGWRINRKCFSGKKLDVVTVPMVRSETPSISLKNCLHLRPLLLPFVFSSRITCESDLHIEQHTKKRICRNESTPSH